MNDLLQLGNSVGTDWKKLSSQKFLEKLKDEAQWLKWRVMPEDAIRTPQPIEISEKIFESRYYSIVRPTEIDKKIFENLMKLAQEYQSDEDYGYDVEFPEGREIERKHKLREQNQALSKAAKEAFKREYGRLYCQVCNFDFYLTCGEIGKDYIEGHHILPLSDLDKSKRSKVSDIAMVCLNCHRMLHKRRPKLKMLELKDLIS